MPVVDPEITALKLDREIELWREQSEVYRSRGWLLLRRDGAEVDVGFLARIGLAGAVLPAITACVRFDYTDYDVQPPSVEFIDPLTGDYATPLVQAVVQTEEGPRNLLVGSHPDTNRPFFCVPGTRQYHDHPQHSGDPWLLHRAEREGGLVTICDRIWRSMARNVLGLQLALVTLPPEAPQQLQVQMQIVSGDVDALRHAAQSGAAPGDAAGTPEAAWPAYASLCSPCVS